ncbi:hypothetical protein PV797_03890 [Clostridiaceae bacterium M8S5]|nr:hypothetical protein PV797_03890 [Clostridiaceae bacterium M8S5]
MKSEVLIANDNTVINIQNIFNLIQYGKFEEAFLLSSQTMTRGDCGDQLFHEWVKSLAEFYSCKNKKTAIQLLEKIKPDKLENEIHFRIINSLMSFYGDIKDEHNFILYKEKLESILPSITSYDLKFRILVNISNGYYDIKNYKKSLNYCEKSICIAQKHMIFDFKFCNVVMIKIMNLFYLGETEKANDLKMDFTTFLRLTNNLYVNKYLDKALDKFNKEVLDNE